MKNENKKVRPEVAPLSRKQKIEKMAQHQNKLYNGRLDVDHYIKTLLEERKVSKKLL